MQLLGLVREPWGHPHREVGEAVQGLRQTYGGETQGDGILLGTQGSERS